MAKRQKTKRFSIQAYDNKHYQATEQYTRAVDALFDAATKAIAQEAAKGTYDPDKPFNFTEHPKVQSVMQNVTAQLASRLTTVIESGSKKQWLFACDKNDGFIASIMDTSKLSKAHLKKMQDRNLDALQAFQGRKVEGMNLSQRVWKYVGQYKEQMEQALDVGLGEGRSAQQLARDVKKNLQEPDRLFRRVRDKRGNLVLSKNAQAYHPGRGVYRSSVKNAQRLTRSEINMAYRESDWQRWQTLDFVVGFEIMRSNHDPLCKCDLCEKLKGRYPKTFKFKGWHPQCMCYAIPILADEETFDENELGDLKAALHGTTYEHKAAKNTVVDVPQAFKDWVDEHKEAQGNWGSTPYFIKDNFKNGNLADGLKFKPIAVAQQIEQAVEVTHKPWEELRADDHIKYNLEIFKILEDDWELEHACGIYGVDYSGFEKLRDEIAPDDHAKTQYWRIDELRQAKARLVAELKAKIAATKTEAERMIAEFKTGVDRCIDWVDVTSYKSTLQYAEKVFADESSEIYPNYITIVRSTSLKPDFNNAIADMKAKWEKAKNDAQAIIANPNGKNVEALKEWVTKTPGKNYAAYEIVEEINKEIARIANSFDVIAAKINDAKTIDDVRKVVVDDFKVLSSLEVCDDVKNVDTVKTLATQVTKSIKLFDMKPIDLRIKQFPAKDKNTFMWANGRYIEVNAKYWGDSALKQTTTDAFSNCAGKNWMDGKQTYIKRYQENADWYKKHIEEAKKDGDAYALKYYEKELKKCQKEIDLWQGLLDAGMTRHNVFLSPETMMRDCIAHETGHTVQGQIMGYYGYLGQCKTSTAVQTALTSELKTLYKRHKATCGWLSDYGRRKDEGEFFSESMVLYQYDKSKLPDDVRAFFDIVMDVANGGSLPTEMPSTMFKAPKKARKKK